MVLKQAWLIIIFFVQIFSSAAQKNFTGIVKYKMTTEGNTNSDSMVVVFGNAKVRVILFLPGNKNPGIVGQKIFIDDFENHRSISLNEEDKTYHADTLLNVAKYEFINTRKIAAAYNNLLCFTYVADSMKLDKSAVKSMECLAALDFSVSYSSNYFFLGIQPIIVDNRIVMDFTVTQPSGGKQKIYVTNIKKTDDMESNFSLANYRQIK